MAVNRTSKARGKVLDVPPNAPTIGSPTDAGDGTTATIGYTAASSSTVGGPVYYYTATSNPGGFTGTGTSSPISVTGLSTSVAYTFTVAASNPTGSGPQSAASTSLTLAVPTSYESIATVSVGSGGVSSVTFSSIPSTYKHLQIRYIVRSLYNGTVAQHYMRMNGVTSTGNYNYHRITGNGSSVSAGGTTFPTYAYLPLNDVVANTGGANMFYGGVMDILDYKDTNKLKVIRSLEGGDYNGSGSLWFISGTFNSTNAISSITFECYNQAQYSHYALYGIKG